MINIFYYDFVIIVVYNIKKCDTSVSYAIENLILCCYNQHNSRLYFLCFFTFGHHRTPQTYLYSLLCLMFLYIARLTFLFFFWSRELITFIGSTRTQEIEALTMSFQKEEKIEVVVMEEGNSRVRRWEDLHIDILVKIF